MEKVDKSIEYYFIFCPKFDADSIEFDLLEQIRRNFFENGKKQKNKITKELKGKTYHYSYAMENQKPMKWKKMVDGKILEKSVPDTDGYKILFQNENKDLVKTMYFDNEHNWIKSEYYSKAVKGRPIFSCHIKDGIIQAYGYNKSLNKIESFDLYPYYFNTDDYKINAFNEKFTTIFCRTSKGEISYCTKDQIDEIEKLRRSDDSEGEEISDEMIEKMVDDIMMETEILVDELSDEIIETSENSGSKNTESEKYEEVTWEEAINSNKNESNEVILEHNEKMPKNMLMTKIIKVGENEELFYNGKLDENCGRIGYGRTFNKNGITIYEGEYLNDKRNGFGVHHYSTGEVFYVGNFKDNNRDGLGILFPKNHDHIQVGAFCENKSKDMVSIFDSNGNLEYAGCIKNGKKTGAGASYLVDNNTVFVGVFKDGAYTGKGTAFDKEGNLFYTGEFKGTDMCGFGTEYNKDTTIRYRGNFKDNKYNGEGTLYLDNGGYIIGNFKDGKVDGTACEYSKSWQKVYEGAFKDFCYFGEGTFYLDNGNYIKGVFGEGEVSGVFFEYDKDGNLVYEGGYANSEDQNASQHNFKERKYNGNGALFDNGKCIYKGNFIDGAKSGFGIAYDQGKITYIGEFKYDQYDGCGILFNDNKPVFAGSFVDGKKHGRGNELYEDRVIKECVFDNDELKYVVEYGYPDMGIVYYGNISGGKKNGMGCEFSEYAEKISEGIFEDGIISHRMSVCMSKLEPLCECQKLNAYGYDKYRKGSDFFVDVNYNGGIYSGTVFEGKPHGKGTILYSDHRYTGEFANGVPSGDGILYKNDGTQIQGTFSTAKSENSTELEFLSGVKYIILNFNG